MLFAGNGHWCQVCLKLNFSLQDWIVLDCSEYMRARNLPHSGLSDDTITQIWKDNQSGLCARLTSLSLLLSCRHMLVGS